MLPRQDTPTTTGRIDGGHWAICVACGSSMQLIRVLPAGEFRSEQLVLRCDHCELVMTQPGN
jgi:hypothetical protein